MVSSAAQTSGLLRELGRAGEACRGLERPVIQKAAETGEKRLQTKSPAAPFGR